MSIALLLAGEAKSSELKFTYPVITYPETISIYFLPFHATAREPNVPINLRKDITESLLEKDDFTYVFEAPEEQASQGIYERGFRFLEDTKVKRLMKKHPVHRYWHNKDIQYLLFGAYEIQDSEITVEVYLYRKHDSLTVLRKRYTGSLSEIQELAGTIAERIVEVLSRSHRHRDYIEKRDEEQ